MSNIKPEFCEQMPVQLIQVIRTTLERRGDGKNTPIRAITQYWSENGILLAESDPCGDVEQRLRELYARWSDQAESGDRFSRETLREFRDALNGN